MGLVEIQGISRFERVAREATRSLVFRTLIFQNAFGSTLSRRGFDFYLKKAQCVEILHVFLKTNNIRNNNSMLNNFSEATWR